MTEGRLRRLANKSVFVQWLVCCAFHGPPGEGMKALHWNDKPLDNRATNLRWGTRAENYADAVRNGTMPAGETKWNAKLTKDHAAEIRSLKGQLSERKIASMFGVSRSTVWQILNGKLWV